MNICQVLAGDEDGGLETHVADLANGLAALGDRVTVIAHPRQERRLGGGVCFRPLDLTRSRRSSWLRRHLKAAINAVAPDVVHAHAGKAAALVAAVAPRVKTIGTVHGLKKDLRAYRRFDAVIGVSPPLLAHLAHPAKTIVYNGVAAAPPGMSRRALRSEFAFAADEPVTLAAGRLVRVKGHDRLIDLWEQSLGRLLIVGDGPLRSALERRAAGKPVTFAGFRADVRAIMAAADLMAFASEREGFSYALAEALLAHLPVVSTPVPGAKDVLPASHVVAALGLKAAIGACLADLPAARERMSAAFDWAAATLTVGQMVARTRQVYADALR